MANNRQTKKLTYKKYKKKNRNEMKEQKCIYMKPFLHTHNKHLISKA